LLIVGDTAQVRINWRTSGSIPLETQKSMLVYYRIFQVCHRTKSAPFSTILHLYRGDQFYWWRKPKYPDKTTNLSWVTGFQLTTLVVICTDCISSCKSTYHTITTTTAPILLITLHWLFLFDLQLLTIPLISSKVSYGR
jgi:hypothetical protein